jgi:acetylornithine/succinyldiaminopimelate/putrescine aminotransferase
MGRTGAPFAANLYGVTPDMLTTPRRWATASRCGAAAVAPRSRGQLKARRHGHDLRRRPDGLRGAEAVIDTIESEELLAQRAQVSAYIRALHGRARSPAPGRRLPAGPAHLAARQGGAGGAARRGILAGTSADPHILRLLPPTSERRARRPAARCSTGAGAPVKRFLDLADFSRDEVLDLLALAQRCRTSPSRARSRARSSACCS